MKKALLTLFILAVSTAASAFNVPPGKYYYDNSVTQWSAPHYICGHATSVRQYPMTRVGTSDIWVYERDPGSNTWSGATDAYFIAAPLASVPSSISAAAAAAPNKSVRLAEAFVGQLLRTDGTWQLMDVFIKHAWTGSSATYVAATKISDTEWRYEGLYGSGAFSVSTNDPTLGNAATGTGVYQVDITPSIVGGPFSMIDHVVVTYKTPQIVSKPATTHTLTIAKSSDDALRIAFSNPPEPNQVIHTNTPMSFTGLASKPATLAFYLNGEKKQELANATSITQAITFTQPGINTVKVTAAAGGETDSDEISLSVIDKPTEAPRPAGTKYGINYIDDNTVTLVLYAPGKQYICAVGDFNDWIVSNDYMMKKDGDAWWITLTGLEKGREYAFYYHVDGLFNVGDPYTNKVLDSSNDRYIPASTYPNLRAFPSKATGSNMVSVFQPGKTPYNWQVTDFKGARQDHLIIYELLVRDFTTVPGSNGDLKEAMKRLDYLQTLGINAIELMPINEFDGNNSWGYNPAFYFAPDKAYGTENDYKQFIDECHKRGIAVIIDMVFNHSYGQSPFKRLYSATPGSTGGNPSSNNPWYNVTSPHTCYSWGSDFNHDSKQTQALIDSVCSFWMNEYKVDGFRFDFTKGFTNTSSTCSTNNGGSDYDASRIKNLKRMYDAIKKRNSRAYVILEHFCANSEETELANYGMMIWKRGDVQFQQAGMAVQTDSDFSRLLAKNSGWSYDNMVGYMESHDEERLAYKVRTFSNLATSKPTTLKRQTDQLALCAAFFLTLPGPKMLLQFGELGYDYSIESKRGASDLSSGYRTDPKDVRWDYYNVPERKELYDTYCRLIDFRKKYANSITNGTLSTSITTNDWPIRRVRITDSGMSFLLVGNFHATSSQAVNPGLTGTWYDMMTGEVTSTALFNLGPGQFKMFTDKQVTYIPASGLDTALDKEFKLFPNPARDVLYFTVTDDEIASLSIWNLFGKVVASPDITGPGIDISSLVPGLYVVKYSLKNGKTGAEKVMIE